MNAAIKLINYFIDQTSKICSDLCEIAEFEFDQSLSATKDCHTVGVIKVHELDELCGFFLATAEIKSDDITFVINYGDIEYGLFYCVYIAGKKYSFDSYLTSILGKKINPPISVMSEEALDKHLSEFKSIILETLPVFLQNKTEFTTKMTEYSRLENYENKKMLRESNAHTAIRKANMLFIEKEYGAAYEIYESNREFLSQAELVKMFHSLKSK